MNLLRHRAMSGAVSSRLPPEYQEVEYIQQAIDEADRTYIATDFTPNQNSGLEIKATRPNHYVQTSSSSNRFGIQSAVFTNGNTNVRFVFRTAVYPGGNTAVPQYSETDIYEASLINKKYTVKNLTQDTTYSGNTTTSSFTAPRPFCIFASRTLDTIQMFGAGVKLYYIRLYQGTNLVHDYVPCYRKSDHEAGLYDLIDEAFSSGATAGALSYGPEV